MADAALASRESGAASAARWLSLAAAPSFAAMALLTGSPAMPDIMCMHEASPLGGMAAMYGLMAVFHLSPWLRLIGGRAISR